MKTYRLLAACALLAAVVVGCSQVLPAPNVEIINVNPPALSLSDSTLTITFKNVNNVDAIVTKSTFVYSGANGSETVNSTLALFIPANTEVDMVMSTGNLNTYRLLLGANTKVTMTFSGIDAYGYDKPFTVFPEITIGF